MSVMESKVPPGTFLGKAPPYGGTTAIRVNEGHALLHLAGMYPTLLEVILEQVQNSLDRDVEATHVWISINYKTNFVSVRDNGKGATTEKFNAALASVATPGRKGEGSLGQFGIGLISPLGKCAQFTFTSCPAEENTGYHEWSFVTKDIVEQHSGLLIPVRQRDDLEFGDRRVLGKTNVPWRSEMSLSGVTRDRVVSDVPMDRLIGSIQQRYGTTMRHNKVVISVKIVDEKGRVHERPNVTAPDFHGQPLPVKVFKNDDAGETTFRLFVAPRGKKGRVGNVLMGVTGGDFRVPAKFFIRGVVDTLNQDVTAALTSGIFEGEILSQKVTLHPTRRAFNKNDALVGLCCALEEWYEAIGKAELDRLKESRREVRLQELGLRSLEVFKTLLRDPQHQALMNVIKSFGKGTVGPGHVDPPKKKLAGQQGQPSLSIDGKPGVPRSEDPNPVDRGRGKKNEDHPEHVPLTAAGPKGPTRRVVRDSNFGLQFAHAPMEGSPDLYKLDADEGILIFNIRHPLWTACEERDAALMKLQELMALQALTLHMMPDNMRPHQEELCTHLNPMTVSWILEADKARGSIPNPSKKASGVSK